MPNSAKVTANWRIGAAVERARGHDMVALLGERQQRDRLRRHARRRGEGCAAALQRGYTLLQRATVGLEMRE